MVSIKQQEIKYLPIDLIRPNPYQPRKIFDTANLQELCDSIKAYGVIQPISVRVVNGNSYELISGERRLRASKLAGLKTIPAIVFEAYDEDSAVIALIENLQRKDLNFLEEAEGYYNLINDHNLTQEKLAAMLGKSQSTIANKLRLLKLNDSIKAKLIENNLTERHARALLRLPDEELQNKAIDIIIKKKCNVKETEKIVQDMINKITMNEDKKQEKKKMMKFYKDIRIFVNTIKQAISIMKKSGVDAEYTEQNEDDYIEFKIRIPKK
ncbi:nucleoid occlusion protein [Thermoanaerobacterium thermosaccharolyticum]|jgi:ParB family chromosome partitioning protein|uniref:ParB-like protein partition protein n=2 Tax=Thermoanaerobacterium thermosaccharolyticum TaxID=1517 RepID=D9TRI5_THETC|nr:nucleoid occlusion protein [Thermoanaerobacterium thermosaccharolyticum]TCW35261.1 ParB family chromosome partitioning protein [Thermohydrogenium kirishiense]ADL70190.1 parB-like protein partition protein [Thermoanaerobacterium thermosaccharolyticum DSM 571]AST57431.1 parB-like partition protein [Thermoanaerobacterium thermosaccharolyticum]KAA5806547.1 nucleoid occlusion protein [Thermoanaerobacterium thermosaccharolyticum]MCP2240066.1 ParB family chromosome partitioning protein [Thermoanae